MHNRLSPDAGATLNGRYYIDSTIEVGGYGTVVKAIDLTTNDLVAIKIYDADDRELPRFAREVGTMQAIVHPALIRILDHALAHAPPFYVMPLANCTLDRWASQNRGNEAAILDRFLMVCEGVVAIHAANKLHRDLKPTNMLVLGDSTLVSDLGLVRSLDHDASRLTTKRAVGTGSYMAPEQRANGQLGFSTDVYALGRSLYELLSGRSPELILESAVNPALAPVITKATKEDPTQRFQTIAQFVDAIHVYRRMIDPTSTLPDRLGALQEEMKALLAARNEYRPDRLRDAMNIWLSLTEPETAMRLWDEFPSRLMTPMAKEEDLPLRILRRLRELYRTELESRGWGYAETVATRMADFYASSLSPEVQAEALRLILVAAVHMNRFAAMDKFNELLKLVSEPVLAINVAGVLQEELAVYARVAAQVQREDLHVALRGVRDAAIAQSK
jgi:serine/threonine protein kinase